MKRYFAPILVIILMLTSGMVIGCSQESGSFTTQDKPKLTEEEAIQMTYDYLIAKTGQLQGAAQAKDIIIGAIFRKAVLEATSEILDVDDLDEWGEPVQFDLPSSRQLKPLTIPTWTGALKKLAKYKGDGLWSVSIEEWEWQLNERTGGVTAKNEEAAKLLDEITLKTYYNSKYGYYLEYPPSWIVYDNDKSKVLILLVSPKVGEASIYIHVIEERELAPFKGLQGYIVAKLVLLQSTYYEFELMEATTDEINYTYRLQKDSPKHEVKRYFMQYGSKVYEIVSSAELTAFEEYYNTSRLYDPFDSFRFQP